MSVVQETIPRRADEGSPDARREGGKTSFGRFLRKDFRRNRMIYAMALPLVAYYAIFHYAPMYGAVIAFKQFNIAKGIWDSPWVGVTHFTAFFDSYYFWRILRNTLLLSVYQLLWGFPAPLVLALLLNEVRRNWYKRLIQTIAYLPHFISVVVVCGLVVDLTSRHGLVTELIVWLGGKRTALLAEPGNFRTIFISSGIWQEIGWGSIIYLAALSGINPELYEAAKVEGAGRFRQMLHITLPGIMPIVVILLILKMGQMMDVSFEKVILLYNPNTYATADVISSFVYRSGLAGGEYSYSSAIGLFQSAINCCLLLAANGFARRVNGNSLW
ncbi:ABC transporter permease [Paenibacillus cymbidii]|uniref:ABC transporter permease n=1 Tax=Paenibacillus cymbidii TaxID=1639034 RepID=UPI001080378E|nr:ABC transporter permease subunit [Paenibacillus cymbidii]